LDLPWWVSRLGPPLMAPAATSPRSHAALHFSAKLALLVVCCEIRRRPPRRAEHLGRAGDMRAPRAAAAAAARANGLPAEAAGEPLNWRQARVVAFPPPPSAGLGGSP
jgi:hypothetical protein